MPTERHGTLRRLAAALVGIGLLGAGCGGSSPQANTSSPPRAVGKPTASSPGRATGSSPPASTEKPIPAESNPPGDIPDNTQFVPYRSAAGHFVVRIPEGWARVTDATSASFTDKLNSVTLAWSPASSAPTPSSVKSGQVPQLRRSERAFTLGSILACAPTCSIPYSTAPITVTLGGGSAVAVTYQVNSAPSSVTGKQYRLEVIRLDFYRNGEETDLVLSGPVGSDNVDPWRLVAQSYHWT